MWSCGGGGARTGHGGSPDSTLQIASSECFKPFEHGSRCFAAWHALGSGKAISGSIRTGCGGPSPMFSVLAAWCSAA